LFECATPAIQQFEGLNLLCALAVAAVLLTRMLYG
jgi:hypothetical protein